MSRNSLRFSANENICLEDNRASSSSSLSPAKTKASSLSPAKKTRQISPAKRQPLGSKNSNSSVSSDDIRSKNRSVLSLPQNAASLLPKQEINSDSSINKDRKWLRKGITVTKTGSFAASHDSFANQNVASLAVSPLRKTNSSGLIRYKSLVLDESSIVTSHVADNSNNNNNNSYATDKSVCATDKSVYSADQKQDTDDMASELASFWESRGQKGQSVSSGELISALLKPDSSAAQNSKHQKENHPSYLRNSVSYRKLLASKKELSLYDEVETVPGGSCAAENRSVEPHSEISIGDKLKLNEFRAPFRGLHRLRENELLAREFYEMNGRPRDEDHGLMELRLLEDGVRESGGGHVEHLSDSGHVEQLNNGSHVEHSNNGSHVEQPNSGGDQCAPLLPSGAGRDLSLSEFAAILSANGFACEHIALDL